MQLTYQQRGTYLLVQADGRLDASWADDFTDALMERIREGHHRLIVDASRIMFLSSAGIRALLRVHKALSAVQGSLQLFNPTDFVRQTLETSGFAVWLIPALPDDRPGEAPAPRTDGCQEYALDPQAALRLTRHAAWRPWQVIADDALRPLTFARDVFALGIGSAEANPAAARGRLGEFLAAAGNVVYQPPSEESRPDYLTAEKEYLPALQCAQALAWQGPMAHLLRFAASDEKPFFTVTDLLDMIFERCGTTAGFVILGEIEGLVGATLIRAPGPAEAARTFDYPEVKQWLSFSGERIFAHQQALITGVAEKRRADHDPLMPPISSRPDLAAHLHAAVFPYQVLPNGCIDLAVAVGKFFSGPPPLALMHLIDDTRPAVGLGQSALIRGACWFAPIQDPEVSS